ncbi:MAG: transporter ATP-binding protein, partial [Candidatus Eremiobacteraeota bacterium]|nr:transporter ATP-binding protein [Candidatus Eremiobacteraeota bacterium]
YRFYHIGDDETLALRGVSLTVHPGETVAVVGPSGSGKSTLLACIAGLDEPDGGHVDVAGRRVTRRSEPERASIRAHWIGIMLQSGNLLGHLSVADNIRLQQRLAGRRDDRRVDEVLELVQLRHRARSRAGQLSGGEAARAGLAIALAAAPPLLLADEPTGEVDAESERRILQAIALQTARGGAAILATHSEAVAQHADRVIHLQDGRVVAG